MIEKFRGNTSLRCLMKIAKKVFSVNTGQKSEETLGWNEQIF